MTGLRGAFGRPNGWGVLLLRAFEDNASTWPCREGGVGVALSRTRPTVSHSIWYSHGTIREIGHDVVGVLYEYSTAGFLRNTAR